jgi:hypothetical protein
MNFNTTGGAVAPKDSNTGGGHGRLGTGHPATGTTQGMTRVMYQYTEEEESNPEEVEDEVGMDRDVINAIRSVTDSGAYRNPNRSGRKDNSDGTGRNQGSQMGLTEDHTTPITKGLSPRLTYRQKDDYNTVPKNTKGPGFGTQSNAQYIRNKPGRISGTQFGTSRAPLPNHDEYDDNIFSLFDLKDPMERSFLHHQKRVNHIKSLIKEIEEE